MKCVFDTDRKAFYVVPVNAADRNIIQNLLGMTTAGDFVLLVRQDVPQSDGVLSHLEVCRFNYNAARPFSAYELAAMAQNPGDPAPDSRGGLGTKRTALAAYVARRAAVQSFIAGLLPGVGDIAVLPGGSTVADPENPVVVDPGPTTPINPITLPHLTAPVAPAKG